MRKSIPSTLFPTMFALVFSLQAGGGVISVNILRDPGPQYELASSDVAGAEPAANWTNWTGTNGATALDGGTLTDLVDSDGNTTTVDISSNDAWNGSVGGAPSTNPDEKMFNGMPKFFSGVDAVFTVEELDTAPGGMFENGYDVLFYVSGEPFAAGDSVITEVQMSSTGYTGPGSYYLDALDTVTSPVSWIQSTDTASGTGTQAHYVRFSGLTANEFTVTMVQPSGRETSPTGIQIVAIPEPGTLGLLGVTGLALLLGAGGKRRRS